MITLCVPTSNPATPNRKKASFHPSIPCIWPLLSTPAIATTRAATSIPAHNGLWRSLVARLTGGQEVAGSNPASPTTNPLLTGFPLLSSAMVAPKLLVDYWSNRCDTRSLGLSGGDL